MYKLLFLSISSLFFLSVASDDSGMQMPKTYAELIAYAEKHNIHLPSRISKEVTLYTIKSHEPVRGSNLENQEKEELTCCKLLNQCCRSLGSGLKKCCCLPGNGFNSTIMAAGNSY